MEGRTNSFRLVRIDEVLPFGRNVLSVLEGVATLDLALVRRDEFTLEVYTCPFGPNLPV